MNGTDPPHTLASTASIGTTTYLLYSTGQEGVGRERTLPGNKWPVSSRFRCVCISWREDSFMVLDRCPQVLHLYGSSSGPGGGRVCKGKNGSAGLDFIKATQTGWFYV